MTSLSVQLAMPAPASAAPVRVFRAQSVEAFLAGTSVGVAVDSTGALGLAQRVERLATLEEPFAFALVRRDQGWAVGTGNDGKVLAVGPEGGVTTLLDADESEIFALWADPDGTLFAGSSPDGKVYRLGAGAAAEAEIYFDPEETYIWALARDARGVLWVATGAPGRLYRVTGAGLGEQVWDGGADHVRSLLPLPGGDLLFGTAGDARILRWHDGSIRTIYDSELNEVVALAAAPDGGLWAAILSSEASFVDLAPRAGGATAEEGETGSAGAAVISVDEGQIASGSRPAGSRAPRSRLVRIGAGGSTEDLWSSTDETIFALAADGERLWAGTGLGGRLYRFDGTEVRVEKQLDEKQIVALVAGGGGPELLSTNGAGLWRLEERREAEGSYTSAVFDAQQPARFGVLRWRGELAKGAGLTVSARSGFSSEPDATWTEWSAPSSGPEVDLSDLAVGRFVQIRLNLEGQKGIGPRVTAFELTYLQENLRPSIASLTVLEAGQILVPAGFNAADQLFEPVSPNREGIFDTLKPSTREERLKPVWKRGWRTLRWEASDANGDALRFRIQVRPEARPEAWLELVDELDANFFSFDSAALPDGDYRFRLTASDARDNLGPEDALEAQRESELVVLDQTPPELVSIGRTADTLRVEVADRSSSLRSAEVSLNGTPWRPVATADRLLDGQREVLLLEGIPADARTLLLRLMDSSFNVRTFDLLAAPGGGG